MSAQSRGCGLLATRRPHARKRKSGGEASGKGRWGGVHSDSGGLMRRPVAP
jgi:hypothetical protein